MTNINWKYGLEIYKDGKLYFASSEEVPLTRQQAENVFHRMQVIFHEADGMQIKIKRWHTYFVQHAYKFADFDNMKY